jgi:hypothetical protein
VREAEKSIGRVLDTGWVYYDEFLTGVYVPLGPTSAIMLKKVGRNWKYAFPEYTTDELGLIKAAIFEGLFQAGMVATGTHNGRECFKVNALGQNIFAN